MLAANFSLDYDSVDGWLKLTFFKTNYMVSCKIIENSDYIIQLQKKYFCFLKTCISLIVSKFDTSPQVLVYHLTMPSMSFENKITFN